MRLILLLLLLLLLLRLFEFALDRKLSVGLVSGEASNHSLDTGTGRDTRRCFCFVPQNLYTSCTTGMLAHVHHSAISPMASVHTDPLHLASISFHACHSGVNAHDPLLNESSHGDSIPVHIRPVPFISGQQTVCRHGSPGLVATYLMLG